MLKNKDFHDIPKVVIERLPRYYRYFDVLEDKVEKVSSKKLGELMGASASQVRLDLSYFGDFGQQGYGYNVRKLKNELARILNINQTTTFVIVGAGNIGRALTRYRAFANAGFVLKALFDVKPALAGEKINSILIHPVEELASFVRENAIDIGVIAVPKEVAKDIAQVLASSGVRGILNFAPVDLDIPGDVIVESIHIIDKMLSLSFIINSRLGERSP
jgi:redox-sensing transcriptional repressor